MRAFFVLRENLWSLGYFEARNIWLRAVETVLTDPECCRWKVDDNKMEGTMTTDVVNASFADARGALSAAHLDIHRLAATFIERVQDGDTGVFRWLGHLFQALPKDLRRTLRLMIAMQLDWRDRAFLNAYSEGRALLLQQAVDKSSPPVLPQLPFLAPRLAHDFFGGLALERGSDAAKKALIRGQTLLVALRRESSTLWREGRGSYDDQLAVLRGHGKTRSARIFPICTEPGAQYSQRSAVKDAGRVDARYAHVKHRKADGVDINKDGIKDAGRLTAGTYEYFEKAGGFLGGRAFQVKTTQVVERDTDGDGRFTRQDPSRVDRRGAGTTMYIHRGGAIGNRGSNTWSAGCQTIPLNIYSDFLSALGSSRRFFYVLINAK